MMALGGAMRSVGAEEGAGGHEPMSGGTLHEQLVAYTDAIAGALMREERSDVWSEHSYARARCGTPSASVRVLLAPPAASTSGELVDVVGEPRAPPPLPRDRVEDEPDMTEPMESDDDWEERVVAHPPSKTHARLARTALQALGDARLACLALAGRGRAARRGEARAAAARLRSALAPLWAWPGAPALRPPAWLHAQLVAHLPAAHRELYDDVLVELRRAAPRLAERLCARPPPAEEPPAPEERAVSAQAAGPWLAWLRCGCGSGEARWERRLSAALHTRVLGAVPPAAATPERWVATALHAAKQTLADVLEDARGRPVIVGGAGAGAAAAAALASGGGGGVAGVLLVGPAALTAEGPRELPDDALLEVGVPVLAVCGGRGAAALAGGSRRVLAVAGADAALRLPLRSRRQLRLPQNALDAALVEEMVRWCRRLAEAEEPRSDDDYAHLPALAPLGAPTPGVELAEGRVVARVSGSTPLLLTPRRTTAPAAPTAPTAAPAAAAPPAPAALAAADIMQLPIVFADDEPPALTPIVYPESGAAATDNVTVTSGVRSGSIRYTRVIVAKRGAGGAGGARGAGGVRGTAGAGSVRGVGGARGAGAVRRARVLRP